ncbi:single-stranded DNA-binding protein [Pilimelia columellifera]|uniref:Single-stranded DNA-binding protein n=1 Tax=Pilimelia columellifera subsp. columellifera TaxID=706583 RepID=A0ABP6AT33_9ACTN
MQFTFNFEGNLGADPELRVTPSGVMVAKMSVGHSTRRRTTAGEWENGPTVWVEVTCWRELAERVSQLKRGDTVIVDARDDLAAWAYTNQGSGKAAAKLQVTANNVAVSMRFAEAQALRKQRNVVADNDDPWAGADAQVPDSPAEISELANA